MAGILTVRSFKFIGTKYAAVSNTEIKRCRLCSLRGGLWSNLFYTVGKYSIFRVIAPYILLLFLLLKNVLKPSAIFSGPKGFL